MTVRCHLHYLSRRDNNILDIAAQEQIANLTMDAARLNALKVEGETKPREEKEVNINQLPFLYN